MSRVPALRVEGLESRYCPATVNFINGTFTVTGTDASETITLRHTPTTIIVDDVSYPSAGINRLVVTAGEGDDIVRDGSGRGAFIYGGGGNDTLIGNGGADRLYGGSGNDTLLGGAGNDVIWGGGGTDAIDGGDGVNGVSEGSPNRVRASSDVEAQIIQLVNVERAKAGLRPLAFNNSLSYAADLHSLDMANLSVAFGAGQAMQHTLHGTVRPEVSNRLDLSGYDTWASSFAYGENIAYGYSGAADVMDAWMNSPGHRANILDPSFAEIGVSVRTAADGTLFFTQAFGRQT